MKFTSASGDGMALLKPVAGQRRTTKTGSCRCLSAPDAQWSSQPERGPEDLAWGDSDNALRAAEARPHGLAQHAAPLETASRVPMWLAKADASIEMPMGIACAGGACPTDVCVTISEPAEQIEAAQRDVPAEGLIAPIRSYVGDGNVHLCFMVDPSVAAEMDRVKAAHARMIRHALAVGGTCAASCRRCVWSWTRTASWTRARLRACLMPATRLIEWMCGRGGSRPDRANRDDYEMSIASDGACRACCGMDRLAREEVEARFGRNQRSAAARSRLRICSR